jgi:uncharacterized protein (DUF58 family)
VENSERNDFRKYLDPAVVSRLSSLELKTRYIVEGFLLGLHRSPYHGFSIEFSQHRPYMQGDSPKDIDWRAYGKTDKFYIKQYEEETNLRCSVLLDCSRSMAFSHGGRISKFDYAAMLAASLSYLCIHQKDAAGITLYADTIKKYLPPKASSIYLNEILKTISTAAIADKTNTAKCLAESAEKINHKGLVIILSDFFDDPAEIMRGLKHFRFKKNEVIVFQILDPVERNFAFGQDAIFVDMEGSEEMLTQPYQIQKAYQESMKSYLATLKKECLQNGIDYNLIDTSEPFDKSLFSYLQKRSRLY